ncbi:MAG: rRNA maturation RNase YbeY [candidate division NC10 bacterium]|nr:rRNA maturation RNase YbeY [candidate division NC10 bacterium]
MEISVRNQQRKIKIDRDLLREVTRRTLEGLGCSDAECGVLVVNDKRIAEFNRRFRKVSGPTDVLAFSMREGPGCEGSPQLLGDVVISAERALCQAREEGHSLEEELCFLLVHGLLHLLGWEDRTEAKRKRMLKAQEEILRGILPRGSVGRHAVRE